MLNVKQSVANGIQQRFDIGELGEQSIKSRGRDESIATCMAKITMFNDGGGRQARSWSSVYTETRRKLGLWREPDRGCFVGGGSAWPAISPTGSPNQTIADHAAFANARGMLKYLQLFATAR